MIRNLTVIERRVNGGEMPGVKAPEEERREQILEAARRVAGVETLRGMTIRRVAKAAGLSNGLVLFHFETKELLLMALLDRLLEQRLGEVARGLKDAAGAAPREVLRRFLSREIERLRHEHERERIELFFDFWVVGTRHPEIRYRVRESLERYRALIGEVTGELLTRDSEVFGRVSPDGMAAVAVSLIEGCAIQAVIDPAGFDVAQYLDNVNALLGSVPSEPVTP